MSTPPPSDWLPHDPAPTMPTDPPKKQRAQIIGGITAISLVIIGMGIFTLNNQPEEKTFKEIMATATSQTPEPEASTPNNSEDIHGWSRAEARNACHDKIKDQLASPGSAKFEGLLSTEFSKIDGGSSWKISGHVDAQNLLGAELRYDWSCTVTPSSPDRAAVEAHLAE